MSLRLSLTALAVASVLPCLAQAAAQQVAALDTVVVTGARQAQRPEELLATVDVIDREELERAGPGSVLDLLARQAGIQISNNGGPGKAGSVYIRGSNGNHTLVLIDGVRIGSLSLGTAPLQSLPLSQIERIEILRGPASALYGADAVGGVIQIFTKRGQGEPLVELFGGLGNFGTSQAGFGVSGSNGPWSYALRASTYDTNGISAKPATKRPDSDRDGYRNNTMSGNVGYQVAPGHELVARVLHVEGRNWYDNGKADTHEDATTDLVSLESRNQISNTWQSTVRVSQSRDNSNNYSVGSFSYINSRQNQFSWQNDLSTAVGKFLLGYEYVDQKLESSSSYAMTGRNVSSVIAGWTASLDKHRFQANLREDHNSQYGDKLTYLLGYGYQITPALRATVTQGTSFVSPTFNQLYYPGLGDPNLKPEEGRNRELALRYEQQGTRASVTYFNNKIDNLITWMTASPYKVQQTGHARIEGWELAGATLLGSYELSASVDLLNPKDEDTGMQLLRRAEQSGRLAVTRTFGAFTVGSELIGVGKRFDDTANKTHLGGYGLLNVFGQYQIDRNWRLEARANNLLDKDYTLANGYNTQGANVFVGIRYLSR
jgi:vitamin B12 transporter